MPEFTALVPAGGSGLRVGSRQPKQFMPLAGQPMLAWTLAALLDRPWIRRVDVVLSASAAPADIAAVSGALAASLGDPGERLRLLARGGATRRDSVLGGLEAMGEVSEDAWVLVHDAARPGLSAAVLERLRSAILAGATGALAATPIADTVKRAAASGGAAHVTATVPREGLWQAQTPQVFRARDLRDALRRYPDVTDESAAMERAGLYPELVPGDWRNLKVTTALDVALMTAILTTQTMPDLERHG